MARTQRRNQPPHPRAIAKWDRIAAAQAARDDDDSRPETYIELFLKWDAKDIVLGEVVAATYGRRSEAFRKGARGKGKGKANIEGEASLVWTIDSMMYEVERGDYPEQYEAAKRRVGGFDEMGRD